MLFAPIVKFYNKEKLSSILKSLNVDINTIDVDIIFKVHAFIGDSFRLIVNLISITLISGNYFFKVSYFSVVAIVLVNFYKFV